MGRPRKINGSQFTESDSPEITDEVALSKPATKTVEAEHIIKYKEPMTVPIQEPEAPEPEPEEEFVDPEESEDRPKQPPSFRTKLKSKLDKAKIGGIDQLKLRIDRLPYYDTNGQVGLRAEKEFMGIITCTEEFIFTDEYLAETVRRYGPGAFWFTLRHKAIIVASWHEKVGGSPLALPTAATAENGAINQATPGTFPYTMPQPPIRSVKQELKEAVELIRIVDDLRGGAPEPNTSAAPPMSEEAQLASLLLTDGDIKKKAIKKLLGNEGGETDYIALAIEHGDSIINAFGTMLMNVIQTVKATNQQVQQPAPAAVHQPAQIEERAPEQSAETTTPEDQLLTLVIEHCRRRAPIKIVVGRILEFADLVNEQSPVLSVDGYLELFIELPIDAILEYVKTLPNGEQVVALPHALQWTTELQTQLKEALSTEK